MSWIQGIVVRVIEHRATATIAAGVVGVVAGHRWGHWIAAAMKPWVDVTNPGDVAQFLFLAIGAGLALWHLIKARWDKEPANEDWQTKFRHVVVAAIHSETFFRMWASLEPGVKQAVSNVHDDYIRQKAKEVALKQVEGEGGPQGGGGGGKIVALLLAAVGSWQMAVGAMAQDTNATVAPIQLPTISQSTMSNIMHDVLPAHIGEIFSHISSGISMQEGLTLDPNSIFTFDGLPLWPKLAQSVNFPAVVSVTTRKGAGVDYGGGGAVQAELLAYAVNNNFVIYLGPAVAQVWGVKYNSTLAEGAMSTKFLNPDPANAWWKSSPMGRLPFLDTWSVGDSKAFLGVGTTTDLKTFGASLGLSIPFGAAK